MLAKDVAHFGARRGRFGVTFGHTMLYIGTCTTPRLAVPRWRDQIDYWRSASHGVRYRDRRFVSRRGDRSRDSARSVRRREAFRDTVFRSATFCSAARCQEEYSLSDRQSTNASDRAVDSRFVLVRMNDRLQYVCRRTG